MNSYRGAIALCALMLAGCAEQLPLPAPPPSRALVLEQALAGHVHGEGMLTDSIAGTQTAFTAEINGHWDGHVLTLVEDFLYPDGKRERKTWHLTKLSEGRYSGTREDVIGTADVYQDGPAVRLDYRVMLDTKIGDIAVRFRDILYLTDTGSIANQAVVSKWGTRVARVAITMVPDTPAR